MAMTISIEESAQSISSMLADALSPRKKPRLLRTESYQDRFKTFSPSTYFAKPTCLSPIICAARGWSNYATDMLECSHCHAKLCIAFDPALTPTQKQQVALFYQKQLVSTGHANDMCLFWDDDSKEQDGAVPLYLASVLDPDFVELLEHAAPHTVLLDRANRFAFFPQLMSTKVNPIKHRQDRLLFDRVKQKVRAGYTATLLSLLGWTCREENGGSPTKMMTLECKVCGSEFQGDVVSSHRYYCPWRCGFPQRGEPCWKLLANNIVAIDEEPDNESAKEDALVRLQVALNP